MHLGKKNEYLNTGDAYKDMEGNMKQFTHVDWDPKQKATLAMTTEEEMIEISQSLKEDRVDVIQRILDAPAVYCPLPFDDFIIRGKDVEKITWNEKMLNDEGVDRNKLRDLMVLMENRMCTIM